MYWQYKEEPVLLLGGSKIDCVFLLDDLKDHLDEIESAGGNYVRNTMSQRNKIELKPYRLLESGKFDLNQWNEEYWKRFQNMLEWTYERNIIVQIEVWDRFDYSKSSWDHSPWNPSNNVNYSQEESGFDLEYPKNPGADVQPFFHTISEHIRYKSNFDFLREYQEKFVLKMLSYSLDFPNVLYCMNNETSSPVHWGMFWINFIKREAKKKGCEIYLTDMFNDFYDPEQSQNFQHVLENPHIYTYMDISQINSRNLGETHWERLKWIHDEVKAYPRPINNTKIYGNFYTSFGSGGPQDGVEKFMRDIIAGCASVRFHRPTSGIGLNQKAKATICAVRKIESLIKMWEVEPRMDLILERGYNESYVAARPSEKYLVYITFGEPVKLNLGPYPINYIVKWVDINTGEWGKEERITQSQSVTLHAPGSGGWIAAIIRDV